MHLPLDLHLYIIYTCSIYVCLIYLHKVCVIDPKERLGCGPQTGFSDIKSHAFFRSIDWDLVSLEGHRCPFCEVGQFCQNGPVCTWVPGTWCLAIFCGVVVGFPKLPRTWCQQLQDRVAGTGIGSDLSPFLILGEKLQLYTLKKSIKISQLSRSIFTVIVNVMLCWFEWELSPGLICLNLGPHLVKLGRIRRSSRRCVTGR